MEKTAKIIDGKSKNKNLNPIVIIVFIVLVLYALTLFFVLGWGFITSFKTASEFKLRPPRFGGPNVLGLPDIEYNKLVAEAEGRAYNFFENYYNILKSFPLDINSAELSYHSAIWGDIQGTGYNAKFGHFVLNSFIYAITGSLLYSLVCLITAYLCSKYRYKFSYFMYTMLLIIMTIPLVGTQPATIKLLRDLGLYDKYLGMFVMSANFTGLYFFVYYAFFQGISDTFMEAAEIDGASQFMTLVRIIIPLSAKMIGTIFLLQFIVLWNNYDVPLLYYPGKPTLAYAIYKMSENTSGENKGFDFQETPQRVAGCMILAIPVLIVFLSLKDVIMGNISLGGIKE